MGLFGNDMTEELQSKINDLEQRLETIEKRLMIGGWAPK